MALRLSSITVMCMTTKIISKMQASVMKTKKIYLGKRIISQQIAHKKVAFISTKNLDYIRNSQEIELLKNAACSLHIIGSNHKTYGQRLAYVYSQLLCQSFKKFDIIFIGSLKLSNIILHFSFNEAL